MVRYFAILVHNNDINIYYLQTLLPTDLMNIIEWEDCFTDMFVCIMEKPSHSSDLEALGMNRKELAVLEKLYSKCLGE